MKNIFFKKGFTLIELLVVVAIIGILASVVLSALNSARAKGNEAAIKSNLRNMINQVELSYDSVGSYSGACAAVSGMLSAITTAGGTAACYTFDNTRWAVSARLNSNTAKNWAVDSSGVVTWDTADISVSNMTWAAANTACAAVGEHMPSIEQIRSLYDAYGGLPPGFQSGQGYWSGTTVPSIPANAYNILISFGTVNNLAKTLPEFVRCVH